MTFNNAPLGPTGSFGTSGPNVILPNLAFESNTTQKEKVQLWFIDPLNAMHQHEGFVCLMVCFPLIEAIIRFELEIPPNREVIFSDNSEALRRFAKFMQIPEDLARDVWDAFRNGLLHRAMVKSHLPYQILTERPGRPAEFRDNILHIYVWDLRDAVVAKLNQHRSKLWGDRCLRREL